MAIKAFNGSRGSPARFDVLEVALELIASLRQPIVSIAARDPELARQLRRAAASVPLDIGEGNERRGADRVHHFRIAAGSAAETVMALRVAQAWGHTDAEALAVPLALCDRVRGMLWRLTH